MNLCLAMIVRDEADWIEPALESALALGIDRWVIVDTGSLDETREIVRQKLSRVPGELIEAQWEGYGRARSLALARTHESAKTLMLDADMTIHGELPDDEGDAWLVEIRDDPYRYALPLLTASGPWYYKGAAHAFLARDDRNWVESESTLWVEDRRAGGWRPGKLEDDAANLEREMKTNPSPRSAFYLAQTYKDLDRIDDAIRMYRTRCEMVGWDEENFQARFQLGVLLCEHVSFDEGAQELLRAWRERPTRIEPLRVLANVANSVADKCPVPDDRLFVRRAMYAKEVLV